jgi:hypothetical protein
MIDEPNIPVFDGSKGMTKPERHACHERWCEMGQATPKEGTKEYALYEEGKQCGGCAFFIALTSDLGMDWGVCGNPKSKNDGKVIFEHSTCLHYEFRPAPEEEQNGS